MPQPDEPTTSIPKSAPPEGRKPKASGSAAPRRARADLLALTIDAANARILTLERVDAVGARHELSPEERTGLAKTVSRLTLRRLLEQAFEAGIECVLGDDDDESAESKADGTLSRALLRSLIESSKGRHLFDSETLEGAIVGSLIETAATSKRAAAH